MRNSLEPIQVYLEIGKKKTFAGAIDWPGWCRAGRDEDSALQSLHAYASRYARVLHAAGIDFTVPQDSSAFAVIERLRGSEATDFGAPAAVPSTDARPVSEDELNQLQALLEACWQALDMSAAAAVGKELRKGPRGGGRELEGVLQHVLGGENGYLSMIGARGYPGKDGDPVKQYRASVLRAIAASARGEVPAYGPRGGARWTPRYFVRRAAWHILDHAWEIEDRIL